MSRSRRLGFLSGRVKTVAPQDASSDRYEYITLAEAEPNAGLPPSPKAILGSADDGSRRWIVPTSGVDIDESDNITVNVSNIQIDSSSFNFSNSTTLKDLLSDIDGSIIQIGSSDEVPEGQNNLYFETSRVRSSVSASGDLSYDSASGEFSITTYKSSDFDSDFSGKDTNDLSEGTSNLYFTESRARSSVSGSTGISYNSSTGSISIDNTVATLSDTQTLTNKTLDLTDNTLTATLSQLNSGLSDATLITEAPNDGSAYVRQNGQWVDINSIV